MKDTRKIILFIAMSLDGLIAKHDGDISFLSAVEQEGEDFGYSKFIDSVDTVLLGRKTYDKILSMGIDLPYGDRKVYVLTHFPKEDLNNVSFFSGDLKDLVSSLKNQDGKHIYCDGGSETILQLLQNDLIDEMTISIVPVLLGDGIHLFESGFEELKLELMNVKSFEKGLVQLRYIRARD